MSREILFRGKMIDNEEWEVGGVFSSKNYTGIIVNAMRWVEVDPETVCQYAGLTDKNGRKIFEGDIIRYNDELIGKAKVDQVKYNETHASFCKLHKSKMGLQYLLLCEYNANRCEVIGNIFDNPELLEGE